MMKIGERQQNNIYNFIIEYVKFNCYSPSVREIGVGVCLKSTSTIHNYLKKLHERGLLIVKEGEPRAIKVVGYKFVKDS